MAHLTQKEFARAIGLLADDFGLQRLRDKLVRLNALVMRRRAASAERLADQLYMLTSGLRRQVPATVAFHSLWGQQIGEIFGEEDDEVVVKLADRINACLGPDDDILTDKEGELDAALRAYEGFLAAKLGPERTRLDTIVKALPVVAEKLRGMPLPAPAPAAAGAPAAESDKDEEPATEDAG